MTITRREVVQRMGYAAAGTIGLGALDCSRRTGSETPNARTPIGAELYTVRDLMERDVEGTLDRVAAIGYGEVEFAGYFGRTPAQIRDALQASGLRAPSAHVDVGLLPAQWDRLLDDAAAMGNRYLVVAWVPEQERQTLDDWRRLADLLQALGERSAGVGIQFAYHNHDFEFAAIDDRLPFDLIAESTDPRYVQLELDLYWITRAGGDPRAVFDRWPGRIPLVHVKDRLPDGQMTEVGAGTIDWPGLFAHRAQAGIQHYFVEHDQPADPLASLAASFRYLSGLDLS